ncbi:hypothetical protein BKA61DRAFT_94316 [Leptodontidium sp. MPI-SDFR-AT-0119]|nr:hypothetical protein BKA61DRAFT_94316 [Leptodontidium sp. MPI-SDFR-AT-0119]
MAVLNGLPGVRITICVDGNVLKEYEAENGQIHHEDPAVIAHQEACTITKFIQATTGDSFTINLVVTEPYEMDSPTIVFYIFADGQLIRKPLMSKEAYKNLEWKRVVEGLLAMVDGETSTVLPLKFSAIDSGDDVSKAAIGKHIEAIGNVGEIVVKVYRASLAVKSDVYTPTRFAETNYEAKYHTKAVVKNGQSHGISLGTPKSGKPVEAWSIEKVDGLNFPLAIFKFKYRSRNALKSLLVIPGSPTLEPDSELESDATVRSPIALDPTFGRLATMEEFERQQKEDKEIFMRLHRLSMAPTPQGATTAEKTKSIKPKSKAAMKPESTVKNEKVAPTTVKREHLDDEGTAAAPVAKKQKMKKLKVTTIIDLTSDDEKDAIMVE